MQKPNHLEDPEFEKIVKQKMEELNFSPSETIWEKVELEISSKKKSKRLLVWLFLFLGLALAGGTYFVLTEKTREAKRLAQSLETSHRPAANTEKRSEKQIRIQSDNLQPDDKSAESVDDLRSMLGRTTNVGIKPSGKQVMVLAFSQGQSQPGQKSKRMNQDLAKSEDFYIPEVLSENITGSVSIGGKKNLPALAGVQPLVFRVYPDFGRPVSTAKISPALRKKVPWTIGLTLSPGISGIDKGLLRSGSVTDMPGYNAPAPGAAGGGYSNTPSQVQSGFSFAGGLFIQKDLWGRFSLALGLNYHYYSARIHTGYKINSLPAGYYGPTSNLSAANASFGFYLNGNNSTYINHYHFIELPLSIQMQLNRSNHLPIAWEAGISLSELVGSDALHFDHVSGVYFKENALLNKTQLGASTAILIGFWEYGHLFQAGPELQYGISNLIKDNSGGDQHFLYYGIRLNMSIRRSRF